MAVLDKEQLERFSDLGAISDLLGTHGFALTFSDGELIDVVKGSRFSCAMHVSRNSDSSFLSSFVLGSS